jgi:hypothetical protein
LGNLQLSYLWPTLTAARAKLRPRAKRRPQFGVGLAGLLCHCALM